MLDDLYHLRDRARRAIESGRPDEAVQYLLTAAAETHVSEQDYATVLEPLAELLLRLGNPRGSLAVRWYLAHHDEDEWKACLELAKVVPPADQARTLAALGRVADAARAMEDSGSVAAAAIYREKAEDWRGARALWSRLSNVLNGAGPAEASYLAAIVQMNLARCANECGDERRAHDAVVAAVRLLEEGADQFEADGLRERAFDCFQVLIQLGKEHGTFENVLEGFVNCTRILCEDHLKYFALQYLSDAIAAAEEHDELAAAAALALEASQYARSIGLASSSGHYVARQGELWRKVAQQHVERGDPKEIAENALLAAIVAFGEVGRFGQVGALYRELAELDLHPSRKAHYARAASRYDSVRDDPAPRERPPGPLRQDAHFPDVWHTDLVEWEQRGSAVEACSDVLVGKGAPDLVRRKALLGRLMGLPVEGATDTGTPESVGARVRLADQLGQLQLYVALAPLEKLYESPHRAVRLAVLASLQRLFFKRSFVTLRHALKDHDPGIVESAANAIESLYFPHAFDPLARIVQESAAPRVRASAIRALANVDTREAADFLLGVLEHGTPQDRDAAMRSLSEARAGAFVALAREQQGQSRPGVQQALRQILDARGA